MIDSLGRGKIGTATRFGWTVCTALRVAPSRGPRILHDLRNYSRAIAIIPKFDHSPPNCDSGMALAAYKINPQSSMVAYISDYVLDSVEMGRQNLSVRMLSRRFTRLTNGFSKKLENHAAAVSLYVTH